MNSQLFWKHFERCDIFDSVTEIITKVCANGEHVFILTQNNTVYHCCKLLTCETKHYEKFSDFQAIDIACCQNEFYFVNLQGCVFKSNISQLDKREEIIIAEEQKSCKHGFKLPSSKVRIKSVFVSEFGALFWSSSGNLWASGSMPQISVESSEPQRVEFFDRRTIYNIGLGSAFAAVLARKNVKQRIEGCDTDSDIDEAVFVRECPQCQSGKILLADSLSPLNDICPLGMILTKSCNDSSSMSNTNTEKHGEMSYNEDTSSFSEESYNTKKHSNININDSTSNPSSSTDNLQEFPQTCFNLEEIDHYCENKTLETGSSEEKNLSTRNLKSDKNNLIFDREAAKHFLSKQLSWVYISEDYLNEYAEKPTRIIKENMSNLTSLVYEGVKNVGDKVANLSRHMSSSSDTNGYDGDLSNFIVEDPLFTSVFNYNCNSVLDELHASTSTVASDKDNKNTIAERVSALVACGRDILNSELWMWGDIQYGQLGTGDHIARSTPVLVSSLVGFGVQKIVFGHFHCAALTLDGRLFLWGRNHKNQLSFENNEDKSSPYIFTANSNANRVRDVACGSNHTVIYTMDNNLTFLGHLEEHQKIKNVLLSSDVHRTHDCQDKDVTTVKNLSISKSEHANNSLDKRDWNCNFWKLLASDSFSFFQKYNIDEPPALSDLAIEQQFLEDLLCIYYSLIKIVTKRSKVISEEISNYDLICSTFSEIMYFTAVNVLSLWRFTEGHTTELDLNMIADCEEQIHIYKKYSDAVCNIITLNGFGRIASVVEVPQVLQNLFSDKLPSNKQNNGKKTSEAVIAFAFLYPLNRLNTYKCIIQSLMRYISPKIISDDINYNIVHKKLREVLSKWDTFIADQEKNLKQADSTKLFLESSGKTLIPLLNKNELLNSTGRRFIRDSKTYPISMVHSSRFSSHWFVLMSDALIHIHNNVQMLYPLKTLWVEAVADSDTLQNSLRFITPEDTIHVYTTTSEEKNDWLQVLQSVIRKQIKSSFSTQPPLTRNASFTFSNKSQMFKEAKFSGRWFNGKLHGTGKVLWPDGKKYSGEFDLNHIHGQGIMDIPGIGIYEGAWKENLQNGFGVMKYCSGDVYEGYFKNGLAHGHGLKRQGDFTTSSATLYIGDWVSGCRQGYGVMDDISKGEKYLGNWNDNKKHGCGLIVTLDGIYYEGVFMQDVLTGHGVMVFENGTHYEGEFKSAGYFSGKGILTLSSGDQIDGNLSGSWTDGVKISNANLHINVSDSEQANSKPNSFGKLCVAPHQKWNGLFRECFQQLGISEKQIPPTGSQFQDNKKIWQNVAVLITHSHQQFLKKISRLKSVKNLKQEIKGPIEQLQMIPNFAQSELSIDSYNELKQYLLSACESLHHPLGTLIQEIAVAFNATYGGVRVHPLLLSHAVKELKSITSRIYSIVRLLFPALPDEGMPTVIPKTSTPNEYNTDDLNPIDGEVVSASTLLQPVLLPRVHPSLFVLYALHNKVEDDMYWRRMLKWNKQPDITLMVFLGIDQKFWIGYTTRSPEISGGAPYSPLKEKLFNVAVDTLQQLKTTFSPIEKLLVIRSTFLEITAAVQKALGPLYLWSMDELFPVFHFVVVRAQILQLGSEIHFIEDFLEHCMQNGELGIMFTTLKACYFQILQEKVPINT